MAGDGRLRADLETAEALGVSLKRFSGWEPITTYTYDDDGRLLSSQPEPEWDEDEQIWMLALNFYRKMLCKLCGGPLWECTDPKNESTYVSGPPTRCHKTTATARQMEQDREAKIRYPQALLYQATTRKEEPDNADL